MPSNNVMQIMIQAIDNASDVAKKVDDSFNKLGTTGKISNDKISQSSDNVHKKLEETSKSIDEVIKSVESVDRKGSNQFKRYDESIQKAIVNFNRLDDETQDMLRYMGQMSDKGRETFLSISNKAQEAVTKFQSLENETKNWGNTFDYTKTKLSLMGTDVDSLNGKLHVVGSSIQTYIGDKWDIVKSKASSAAQSIKSTMGGAVDWVKGKVNSLASSFDGLGGIIASAIGGLGVASIGDLTVGLAMTREQMLALTQATLGTAEAADEMINGIQGGFEGLDKITDRSLVSLNDLGQAMNVISMSTDMNLGQLEKFSYIVNDIGQRAILMGKDSTAALSLMEAAGKGLNGEFEQLRENFGITKDKLKNLGWDGTAKDIDGYTEALQKALDESGNMEEMMKTTPGLIALVKKEFSSAGRQIGELFIPYIREALQWFLDFKEQCPEIAKYLILVAGAISLFATIAPMLAPLLSVLAVINIQFIAIAVVLVAVAIAVYNVGKEFGWWTNVTEMLAAIFSGLKRLFDAFRNSPVVKKAVDEIKDAFYKLLDIIETILTPLGDVFSKNDDGTIDIVHTLVEFFKTWGGTIYEVAKYALGLFIVFKAYKTISGIINTTKIVFMALRGEVTLLNPKAQKVVDFLRNIKEKIPSVDQLKDAFGKVKDKVHDAKNKLGEFKDKIMGTEETEGVIDKIKNKFGDLKDKIDKSKESVGKFYDKLKEEVSNKIDTLKKKFGDLKDEIDRAKNKLGELWNKLKEEVSNKIETLKNKFNDLKNKINDAKIKLGELWNKLKENVQGKIDLLKTKFGELKTRISDAKTTLNDFLLKIKGIAVDKINLLKTKFGELKDKIILAKTKLIEFLGKIKEIVVTNISNLATSFRNIADGISLATIKEKLYALWQGIVNGLTAIWNALLAMNPIAIVVIAIVALIAALTYLYYNNETVRESIDWLWQQLQVLAGWIVDNLVSAWNTLVETLQPVIDTLVSILGPAIQGIIALLSGDTEGALTFFTEAWNNLMTALQPVAEFLSGVLGPAWNIIVNVLTIVWNAISQVIDLFQQFQQGQISLPELLMGIWTTIQSMWLQILMSIIQNILGWAGQIWDSAVTAGSNFLTGIINYISQLPGRVASYLLGVALRIISAGASWVSNGIQTAQRMVNGITNNIQELPDKVYREFLNIGSRMLQAGSQLIENAKKIGENIVNGLLDAMGIHSPGIIQEKVVAEFENMLGRVKDTGSDAFDTAKSVGKSLVDGFNSEDVEGALSFTPELSGGDSNYVDLDSEMMGGTSQLDVTANMEPMDNSSLIADYSGLSQEVTGIFDNMALSTGLALDSMTAKNYQTYDSIRLKEQSSMNLMSSHVSSSMSNILSNTTSALNNTTNVTKTNLNNMQNSTAKVTANMVDAWDNMKDNIVKSANNIKTQSTTHFTQLSNTIGGFYKKLQNPSQWGAGPGSTGNPNTVRKVGKPSGIMGKISSTVSKTLRRDADAPYTIPYGFAKRSSFINNDFIEYIGKSGRVKVEDLLTMGYLNPINLPLLGDKSAGWLETANPNVKHIKNVSREWKMKGPQIMGYINSGLNFQVKEFETGTPRLTFDSFLKTAEAVFSTIGYDFYYNSDKTGSWVTALESGSVNCSDGSEALIALGETFGFSGHKVHGFWGDTGHFWAVINGKTMDTTAFQHGYGWTGPAQRGAGHTANTKTFKSTNPIDDLEDIIDSITNENTVKEEKNESLVENIKLSIEHAVNIVINGDSNEIDEVSLVEQLKEAITDTSLVDKIAEALIKRNRKNIRMGI